MKKIFFLFLAISISAPALAGVRSICPGYKIESSSPVTFSKNEKTLICGDKDVDSWKDIPRSQAEFFIRNFLQERGYFFPEFSESDGSILINAGKRSVVKEIIVTGDELPFFHIGRRRKTMGAFLTPALLSQLENWSRVVFRAHGYPCPLIGATADALTGIITLNISAGPLQNIISVSRDKVEGLDERIFRRYDAFKLGQPYNADLLTLTSNRIEADGLVQGTHIVTECSNDGAVLTQKISSGRPKLFKVGFGFSTEEYAIGKASWLNGRMGQFGSSITLSLYGSYRRQEFDAGSKWYFNASRWYFSPLLTVKRLNERQYELFSTNANLTPAVTLESNGARWNIFFGPALNYTNTLSGVNQGQTHFLYGLAGANMVSHDYELYAAEPQKGYDLNFSASFNHKKIFSDATFQQLQFDGDSYWNIGGLSPPLFIIGVRYAAATTITSKSAGSFTKVPPLYLYFLGGSDDLRGFKLNELPMSGQTALTMVTGSLEGRFTKILPFDIQPTIFADIGALGSSNFSLNFPLYWSPGAGLRWPSPVGVIRTTISHGFLAGNNDPQKQGQSHWQFYFSLGEEF